MKKKRKSPLSLYTCTYIYRKSQSKFEKQAKFNTKTDLAFSKIIFYYRKTALVKRKQKILDMNLIVTFLNIFLVGGKLLYNIVLVSNIQQCESVIIMHVFPPSWACLSLPHPSPLGHHRTPGWAHCHKTSLEKPRNQII